MIKITERPLSETERQHLSEASPFFLFKNRREIWRKEFERGQVEVLELEIIRAWEINICTCCPNSYLFQVDPEAYVFIESWTFTKFAEAPNSFPVRKMRVERLPLSKKILAIEMAGDLLPTEDTGFALTDLPNYGETECEVFHASEFSEELRSKLIG